MTRSSQTTSYRRTVSSLHYAKTKKRETLLAQPTRARRRRDCLGESFPPSPQTKARIYGTFDKPPRNPSRVSQVHIENKSRDLFFHVSLRTTLYGHTAEAFLRVQLSILRLRRRRDVDGVVHVRRVRSLGKDNGAGQGAHDDRDDPPEHSLAKDLAVHATSSLQQSHTGRSADLRFSREAPRHTR